MAKTKFCLKNNGKWGTKNIGVKRKLIRKCWGLMQTKKMQKLTRHHYLLMTGQGSENETFSKI